MPKNDFVNELLRSRSPRAQEEERQEQGGDITQMADGFFDEMTHGIAGLRAILGVLSPEGGDDETAPPEVEDTLDAALEALAALRDDVDELLIAHGEDPTTAIEVAAAGAGDEE